MNSIDPSADEISTQNQHVGESWRQICRDEARCAANIEECEAWGFDTDVAKDENEETPFRYRWEHVRHVVSLALWLTEQIEADQETGPDQNIGVDREIVEAAAWLHDVCKREPEHGKRGAERARSILADTDFPPEKIDAVAHAIRQHEGLTRADPMPLQPLEAAVLWDADKLSKIGVQALMVAMSSRYMQGLSLAERRRRNQEFIETVLSQTVKSMNTVPARRLAEERYRQNLDLMSAWARDEKLKG